MAGRRESRPHEPRALPELTDDQVARLEAENALLQINYAIDLVETHIRSGDRFRLRPSLIIELNRKAVFGLEPNPGGYRQYAIEIDGSDHVPPDERDVPGLVDDMCDYVNDHWHDESALHLSAYVMWRLNWIHPFSNGNGRTSRVVAYVVLCTKLGYKLPGTKTVPQYIAENKQPYYEALEAADACWKENNAVDVSVMEELVSNHLASQLLQVIEDAGT